MTIKTLEVNGVRNVKKATLDCSPLSNLIVGPNGSGKTTLLESVSLLSQGKSFRQSQKKNVIADGQSSLTITALLEDAQQITQTSKQIDALLSAQPSEISTTRIGISKFGNGKTLAKIANNKVNQENRIYVDKKLMFNEYWRMQNLNEIKVIQKVIGSEDILLNLLLIYHTGVR